MKFDLRVDGRFPTDDEIARLIPILREKNIDGSRPIRHWTIDFIRAQHGDARRSQEAA